MKKRRILWCGESSSVSSGFGNYTRQILSRLHNTNKYEVAELSCYRDHTTPKNEPWTVYPVAVPHDDPHYNDYQSNDANFYGQWRFDYALLDFKPDIVIDVRDFWNFTYQDTSCLRRFYHWMIAPTYDSSPPKIETLNMFKNADTLMFHTDWAKNDLLNNLCYKTNNIGPVVNDSVDHNIFKPIGYNKSFHKIRYGLPKDSFIIGTVMRNQKRKLIPDILQVFSKVKDSHKNAILYMHTSYPDSMAWDIPSLLLEYNLQNNVLFTYSCANCNKFYPHLWVGPKSICKFCKAHSSHICSLRNPISESNLNEIYNIFDVYIQYAICEGFGIPALEAASAGLPLITIDFGAMGDIGSKLGAKMVPVIREFRELETNAIRCYPDNDECVRIINELLELSGEDLKNLGKATQSNAINNFSWDKTTKIFEQAIDSADISKNNRWDCPQRKTNNKYTVDNTIDSRKFIYDIIDNIIMEPWLKDTTFIEDLIKSTNDGYCVSGIKILPFNKNNVIKILEIYMNNKIGIEMIRCGVTSFPPALENFINYAKK